MTANPAAPTPPTTPTTTTRNDPVDVAIDAVETLAVRGCLERPASERELLAHRLYERVHPAMAALGLLFLVLVLAQRAARAGTPLDRALVAATWVLWAIFAAEYVARLTIAADRRAFLRRTWWQLLFLGVPFLSMIRGLMFVRLARPTRVLLAAVRGTRSARATLTGRVGWLSTFTTIVIFSAADLLHGAGAVRPYGSALHAAALAAINGEPIKSEHALAQVLGVVLAIYAVVFFASLAGMIGAFLLEQRAEAAARVGRGALSTDPDPAPTRDVRAAP